MQLKNYEGSGWTQVSEISGIIFLLVLGTLKTMTTTMTQFLLEYCIRKKRLTIHSELLILNYLL